MFFFKRNKSGNTEKKGVDDARPDAPADGELLDESTSELAAEEQVKEATGGLFSNWLGLSRPSRTVVEADHETSTAKSAPEAEPEPVLKPEPVAEPESLIEPASEIEPPLSTAPASTARPELTAKPEPAANAEPAAKSVPAVEPTPVAKQTPAVVQTPEAAWKPEAEPAPVEEPAAKKPSLFARMKQGLARTSGQFAEGLGNLFLGRKEIDDELLEELETRLLMADVGIEATTEIIEDLTAQVARKQLGDANALYLSLQNHLLNMLQPVEKPLQIDRSHKPYVILVVGVNGVGKTTTIGKLARQFQGQGLSVLLAAGDTFRAAAVEQLQVWGQRNKVPVIAQPTGSDSASVIFDALSSARARGTDVVIADTAGRLHNKSHLMEELAKVKRVMGKLDGSAPHEVLLVLDAGTGQNAVSQADTFRESAGVTGLALTKLDGTAKGGVIFALTRKHQLPVRYIGVGEGIDDLQPFRAKPFVDALFRKSES